MQELSAKMIERAKALLAEGKVQRVVGWKKGLFDDDITPGTFRTAEELDKEFIFNHDLNVITLLEQIKLNSTRKLVTAMI